MGRKPVEKMSQTQCQSIVTWAMPQLTDRTKLPNIVDPVIRDTMDPKHLYQDDDDLLQQALAMSMEGGASGSAAVTDSAMAEAGAVDPDLALALQMSVQDANIC
uniref:Uncharacterized protein n=1 Tax=Zea mays TaxID=4577 RepID=A0A804UFG2_MAIZE